MSILGGCAWNCFLAQRPNGTKITRIQATKHFYPPKLSCGSCSWNALIPRQCPGSVWRRVNCPMPKPAQSDLWQFNNVDAPALVPRTGPVHGTDYFTGMGRSKPFSLPDGFHWDKNAIICAFFPLFSLHKEKMASPSHTHHDSLQPNVLSGMSPMDLKPAEMRKLLFC